MRSTTPVSFDDEVCPSSMLPVRMQHKWAPLVLRLLGRGDHSFSDLRRALPRIGPKELTRALRSLEHDGFVIHSGSGGSVGYGLTTLGRSLLELLLDVYAWTAEHWDEIVDARDPAVDDRTRVDNGVAGNVYRSR